MLEISLVVKSVWVFQVTRNSTNGLISIFLFIHASVEISLLIVEVDGKL